jgi:predicted Zn finger-like uncharacterized protein
MITRCPLCRTAFRVTDGQLGAAGGLVRCGACTHVFQGKQHLVSADTGLPERAADDRPVEAGIEQNYIDDMLREFPEAEAPAATEPPGPPPEDTDAVPPLVEEAPSFEEAAAPSGEESASGGDEAVLPAGGAAPAFAPPPLVIDAPVAAPRRRSIGWAAACVTAALLLAAQYAWHGREQLLRDERLRPQLDAACRALGCTLPRPAAPTLIRNEELVIRPAPHRDGVLLVDALISNHAAYPQAWPALEIVFDDMRGRPLAGRVFAPREYLQESARDDMPVGQPVAVHLEILDPGEDATNYRLFLRGNADGR